VVELCFEVTIGYNPRRVELGGLRVWNYSRDVDTSFRGVQAIEVLAGLGRIVAFVLPLIHFIP
jgi:hypothetical protein